MNQYRMLRFNGLSQLISPTSIPLTWVPRGDLCVCCCLPRFTWWWLLWVAFSRNGSLRNRIYPTRLSGTRQTPMASACMDSRRPLVSELLKATHRLSSACSSQTVKKAAPKSRSILHSHSETAYIPQQLTTDHFIFEMIPDWEPIKWL